MTATRSAALPSRSLPLRTPDDTVELRKQPDSFARGSEPPNPGTAEMTATRSAARPSRSRPLGSPDDAVELRKQPFCGFLHMQKYSRGCDTGFGELR